MRARLVVAGLAAAVAVALFSSGYEVKATSNNGSIYVDEKGITHAENALKTISKNVYPKNDGDTQLAPAFNLSWSTDHHGVGEFEVPDQEAYYRALLEKDGKQIMTWYLGTIPGSTHTVPFYYDINESGTYKFMVEAYPNDLCEENAAVASEYSLEYVYTKPAQSMAVPTNLAWSTTNIGTATWDEVPNAERYSVRLLRGENDMVIGFYPSEAKEDFSRYIGDSADYDYYFKVRTLSPDIDVWANGDYSELSPAFNGSGVDTRKDTDNNTTAEGTKDSVDSAATSADAEKALDDYIGNTDPEKLAVAMQSSSEQRNKIVDLEESYKKKANITVENNVTAPGIDSSKVKIVGAGLNAGAGSNVSFNISKTDDSAKKAINTNIYKNIVQFDMNLSNASKVSADGKLAIPVEITMPVPEGLKKDITLKILHFHHSDDGYDIILPRFNGDGTISFTITHFSTFAFMDELEVKDEVKDDKGNTYKVTAKGEVEYKAPKNKKIKKITIPDTITVGNTKCKVTSIAKEAFKGCAKLQTVTIGKNVANIGKNAFKGDKKVKTITIKAKTIMKIGKNAFKGIKSTATFKLSGSKKQKKALAKQLSKSATGYKKTMTIKK